MVCVEYMRGSTRVGESLHCQFGWIPYAFARWQFTAEADITLQIIRIEWGRSFKWGFFLFFCCKYFFNRKLLTSFPIVWKGYKHAWCLQNMVSNCFPDIHLLIVASKMRTEELALLKILNMFIFFKPPVRGFALENKWTERLDFLTRPRDEF